MASLGRRRAGLLRRSDAFALIWRTILAIAACIAGCYYGLALVAASRRVKIQAKATTIKPGVSILKPIYGWDDRLEHAIATHARQNYPEFEVLVGRRDHVV